MQALGLGAEQRAGHPTGQGQGEGRVALLQRGGCGAAAAVVLGGVGGLLPGQPGVGHAAGHAGNAGQHFALIHPVARAHGEVGVGFLPGAHVVGVQAARLVGVVHVGGPAVVELVNHLGFVQRQAARCGGTGVGLGGAVGKEVAVVGHVQHPLERDAPRIGFWRGAAGVFAFAHPFGLANQHGGGAVELFGQLGIALAAEHRAGAGVGVNQAEFVGREGEAAARVGGLCNLRGKADKFGGFGSAQRHQAEFVAAVNGRENGFTVFKIQQAGQAPGLGDVAKVGFGGVVGGNARGHDETSAALRGGELEQAFGKQRVGIDIAHAGERVAATVVRVQAGGFGTPAGGDEVFVQAHFGVVGWAEAFGGFHIGVEGVQQQALAQQFDALGAFGFVFGGGHQGAAGGKEFFFLQLDALPRRVAQHHRKTAFGGHLRKGQPPMEHAVGAAQVVRGLRQFGLGRLVGIGVHQAPQVARERNLPLPLRHLGREKGGHIGVGQLGQGALPGLLAGLRPGAALGGNAVQGVVGQLLDGAGVLRQGAGGKQVVGHHLLPAFEVGLVLLFQGGGGGFVVATEHGVGFVRDAVFQNLGVQHAQERIAHLQVVVDKGQGPVGGVGLQPQRGFGQGNGHGVFVHAINAVADDIAQGVAVVGGRGGATHGGGAQLGHFIGQTAGGGQQKVPAATGWVAHGQFQQGLHGVGGVGLYGVCNHGVERALDELLHQAVGCVVAAGELARVAFVRCLVLIAHKGQAGGVGLAQVLVVGHQLQQAFIHAAQFFSTHVAVVHARQAGGLAEVAQLEHGGQQVAVVYLALVQQRALLLGKQAAQGRQAQRGLAGGQAAEGDAQGLPQVAVGVVAAAAHGAFAQPGQAVALPVALLLLFSGVGREDERAARAGVGAVFHRGQEDEAIDQAEQFFKKRLFGGAALLWIL